MNARPEFDGNDDHGLHPKVRSHRSEEQAQHLRRAFRRSPRLTHTLKALGALGGHVSPSPDGSREAVVKVGWAQASAAHSLADKTARHLIYLQAEGTGTHGQRAGLFGPTDAPIDPAAFTANTGDDLHQYRLILSPLDGEAVDLREITRQVMRQAAVDLGTRLDWVAAVHEDTGHRHAHVVVHGHTDTGKPLYLSKAYYTHGLKARGREVMTRALGSVPLTERAHMPARLATVEQAMAAHLRQANASTPVPTQTRRGAVDVTVQQRLRRLERQVAQLSRDRTRDRWQSQ